MPTTVIKTIGPSGDYTTLQAALNDVTNIPTNLVNADLLVRLQVRGGAELASSSPATGVARTWDATRRLILENYPGEGFRDHPGKLTHELAYNASYGAAIKFTNTGPSGTPAWFLQGVSEIIGLQFKYDDAGSGAVRKLFQTEGRFVGCLIDSAMASTNEPGIECAGFINSVFIGRGGFNSSSIEILGTRFFTGWNGATDGVHVTGSTIITNGQALLIGGNTGTAPLIKSCALFGLRQLSTAFSGLQPTYSATDLATMAGTGNVVGITAANQFVSPLNDMRVKAGSVLINAGTRVAADTGDVDVVGSSRSLTTPTIGAWEYAAPGNDTTPPTLTGSITIGTVTSSSIAMSWPAASDNFGVTSYEVSKDGGTTWTDTASTATSYTFASLTSNTTYQLRVRAKDAAGNVSTPALAALQATGGSDTTAPVLTGTLAVSNVTPTGYTLTWPAGTDNIGITAYEYSVDGGSTWLDNGLNTSKNVTGRTPGSTDQVRARARDAAGNVSTPALSNSVTLTSAGTITSEPLKDNAGNLLINTPLSYYSVHNDTTGALVVRKTGLSTNGVGVVTFSDVALTAGAVYRHDWETADGKRRMPRKAAA